MGLDQVTRSDIARLMEKLAANFGGKKDLAEKADVWYAKFRHFPLGVLERVVDQLLTEDHEYFPRIGRALKLAKALTPIRASDAVTEMRAWEADPWAGQVEHSDRELCQSNPCPICGSVMQFSTRGLVVVHGDQRHREMRVSYSNIGNLLWFEMAPPVLPESWRKLRNEHRVEPGTFEQTRAKGQQIRGAADQQWEEEQQGRAEASRR